MLNASFGKTAQTFLPFVDPPRRRYQSPCHSNAIVIILFAKKETDF
jgi:hypothetical protein